MATPRHLLITGAGTGIGRSVALELARRGASLTLVGRRYEPLLATAADCMEGGAQVVLPVAADVRDRGALTAAIAEGAEANGPYHGVVANAGVGGPNTAEDDRWDDILATNLTGAYHTARAALEHLAPTGPRHVVFVSSVLGRIGVGGYTAYCASKAGLLGLTRALAMELAPQGVFVNAVCPGWTDTEMARDGIRGIAAATGQSYDAALQMAMRDVPLGRMSTAEEVARVVAWLVDTSTAGVTGQAVDVNNGAWMG